MPFSSIFGGGQCSTPSHSMRDFSTTAQPEVFTLHDMVHRLMLRSGSTPSERSSAMFVRAIQDAIRSLPSRHEWHYFRRQSRFTSSPPVNLSVTYDHSGGASERLLTATSGIFPTDASLGVIRTDDRHTYRISRRLSDTQATLESDFSLSADFAGDVTWERSAYQFSREMLKVLYVQNLTMNYDVTFLPTSQFQTTSYYNSVGGRYFTYQNHGGTFGRSEFILFPPPPTAETYEVSGIVAPLIPHINCVSGEGAVVNGDTATIAGASLDSRYIGSVFRLSRNTDAPIDYKSNDWEWQAFITGVPTATTLSLSESYPSEVTRGYSISSPIDLEASVMMEYVEDEAYHQYTKNHDHKSFSTARQVARESLRLAIAADNKAGLNGQVWRDAWHDRCYLSGDFYTTQGVV